MGQANYCCGIKAHLASIRVLRPAYISMSKTAVWKTQLTPEDGSFHGGCFRKTQVVLT